MIDFEKKNRLQEASKKVRTTYEIQSGWLTWGPKPSMTMGEAKVLLDYIEILEQHSRELDSL